MRIALTVNGRHIAADVSPRMHLADFVREELNHTGTHLGCEHGICGACTLELNGELARSCITYAVCCDGADVRTIEGFDDDAIMQRLRQAFTQHHALQCGYCTPGVLIAARDLIRRKRALSRAEIRIAMGGNLCRCTGYMGIIDAIEQVMAEPAAQSAGAAPRAAGAKDAWLGPAPGPTGANAAQVASGQPRRAAPSAPTHPAAGTPAHRKRVPIRVAVAATAVEDGSNRLTQSFELAHPRAAVWALLSDPERVARCVPGMSLAEPSRNGALRGSFALRIGPITARFSGEGNVRQFPEDYRQIITAHGGDSNSDSRVSGSLEYVLNEVPRADGANATRVVATISYLLTGRLAQIGRSAIARDLARRIGETFAANLDAQLGGSTPTAQTPLGGGLLLLQLAADRLRAAVASVAGALAAARAALGRGVRRQ